MMIAPHQGSSPTTTGRLVNEQYLCHLLNQRLQTVLEVLTESCATPRPLALLCGTYLGHECTLETQICEIRDCQRDSCIILCFAASSKPGHYDKGLQTDGNRASVCLTQQLPTTIQVALNHTLVDRVLGIIGGDLSFNEKISHYTEQCCCLRWRWILDWSVATSQGSFHSGWRHTALRRLVTRDAVKFRLADDGRGFELCIPDSRSLLRER